MCHAVVLYRHSTTEKDFEAFVPDQAGIRLGCCKIITAVHACCRQLAAICGPFDNLLENVVMCHGAKSQN